MDTQFLDLRIPYDKIEDHDFIESALKRKNKSKLPKHWRIVRRSIDARKRPIFNLRIEVADQAFEPMRSIVFPEIQEKSKVVVIIGAGPAGYFAALECLKLGLKPIVLDRGKDVRQRRRDLKAIQQDGVVNPHSNYCFGEGGAGTYSDGKLYTRSHKRGNIKDILQVLVDHGAQSDILVDAHPHIGSNKLPNIVMAIRETIEAKGGEVRFNHFVTDLIINGSTICSVVLENGQEISGDAFVLATGHSARDIFYLLHEKQIKIESKDFALGVRIEHPQAIIDEMQYRQNPRHQNLPAAPYRIACQVEDEGVFSFCMCPGGLIVPAATQPGEIVVNGMSLSRRDSPYANSGFVTGVSIAELEKHGYSGVFAGLEFQQSVEQKVFQAGDGSQKAPAQRALDFVRGKVSDHLNDSSYIPGLYSADLNAILPEFIAKRLKVGLLHFSQRMKNYLIAEANLVATESRTSSPVRIPRDDQSLMHPDVDLLFPCGEGAGYAGGILSAAMDGVRVARAVANRVLD